jgi:hypothetical protein
MLGTSDDWLVPSTLSRRALDSILNRSSIDTDAAAGMVRPGDAGSNTAAADHITVLDTCLAQIAGGYRYGQPILVRTDAAGCTKAFLNHIRALREPGAGFADLGVKAQFAVGVDGGCQTWSTTTRWAPG